MAGEKLGYVYSGIAGADHTGKEGIAVVISAVTAGSNGVPTIDIAGAGVKINGVILRGDEEGKVERIAKDGIVFGVAGAIIAGPTEVEVDAAGKFITKAAGTAVGKVFAAAAADDIVPIFLY